MELMEERELEILKRHQEDYERRRLVELTETQRLEEAERRRNEEKVYLLIFG
jgi:DNA-binding MarR family transcriptional regulator